MEIPLGSKVEDITDGFIGIVTSRTEYMNGCIQYYVRPPVDKKTGDAKDGCHIDIENLKVIGVGCSKTHPRSKVVPLERATAGGPRRKKTESKRM